MKIKERFRKLISAIPHIYKKGALGSIGFALAIKLIAVLFELGGLLKYLPIITGVSWLNTFIYANIFIFLSGLAVMGLSHLMKSVALKSEGLEAYMWEDTARTRGCWITVEGTTQRESDKRIYWKYIRQHIFSPTANAGVIEVGDPRLEFTGRTVKSTFISHLIRLTDFPAIFKSYDPPLPPQK